MKKAVAFILLLCMMLSCVACDFNIPDDEESSKESSKAEEASSSKDESSSESSSESLSEASSESTSSEQTSSEAEASSESESTVLITEYGSYSSAITATKKSVDKNKQKAYSNFDYGKGALSTYDNDKLDSIKSSANFIALGGSLVSYKNASAFMKHYLENTGEDYIINLDSFFDDENALYTRNAEINNALRACEALAVEGESINVYQKEELVHHNLEGDWHYAIGSYFTAIEVKNLTVNGNIYSATITYKVEDFYNWDENDANAVFSGTLASFTKNVSPKDLHQLHRAGMAREFLSRGEKSYTISWVKGSTVDSIPAFN